LGVDLPSANIRPNTAKPPLLPLCFVLFAAGVLFLAGYSTHGKQVKLPPLPAPTLTQLAPNTATIGSAGKLLLRGNNFVPGAALSAPPGLSFSNIRVNSPTEISADYSSSPDSVLGYFAVTVATPGGTSNPAILTVVPRVYEFGSAPPPPAGGAPPFEALEVGIHSTQIANPDGSETDAYLDVSITDEKGHPVTTSPSWHSDMDNVDAPDDDTDESSATHSQVTSYSFALQFPAAGKYVLRIKGSRSGSFTFEMNAESGSEQESLGTLENVPTYPGSSFQLNFVFRKYPFNADVDSGGLQPLHGAFSFAQPLTPEVQLPADQQALGVVIYYDPVMETSSFRATLDGADRTSLFHVRPGELQLVSFPLEPGQHVLTIRANNKKGLPSEQEFHINH